MAHDPTRAWPLGIGPDQTAIPGAAWLELLDGQAFPVVGAGVMVRDGNLWTPASSSNPLHVRAQALEQLIGALNATKVTDPDAASATLLALLRGLLSAAAKESTLGDVQTALATLAGTVSDGAAKVALSGQYPLVGYEAPAPVYFGEQIDPESLAVVFDVNKAIALDSFQLRFNSASPRIRWIIYDSAGNQATLRLVTGINNPNLTQLRGIHPFLKELVWDDDNSVYIFELRNAPMLMPFGIRILIQNDSLSQTEVRAVAVYRTLEVG